MELKEARLEAKLEKLKILSRSREGSKTGSRLETKSIGTSTKSRDSLYSVALSSSSPQMAKKSQVRGSDPKSTDSLSHGNAGSVLEGRQGVAVETDFHTNWEVKAGFQRRPDVGREAAAKGHFKDHQGMDSDGLLRQKLNPVTELRDHRFNSAPESGLIRFCPAKMLNYHRGLQCCETNSALD